MASQTGTLKFRQSDGTYTDLYPKTTIAQVDGLQTQLDSINTSLQNKVSYSTHSGKYITVGSRLSFDMDVNVNSKVAMELFNDSFWIEFYPDKNKSSESYPDRQYRALKFSYDGLYDIVYGVSGSKIATEDYVNTAIRSAINASY